MTAIPPRCESTADRPVSAPPMIRVCASPADRVAESRFNALFRGEAFDALGPEQADATAGEVVRVIAGSDPALLQAMIEACGIDAQLRTVARELRRETGARLAAAFDRVRKARGVHSPALDSTTAASAALALGDTAFGRTSAADVERI